MRISFTVPGIAAPQGSKRHVGRGILVESSKHVRPWRDSIAWHAREALNAERRGPFEGPVNVNVTFRLPRPKSHFRTGAHAGQLKPGAPTWTAKKPDVDKLLRALLDALDTAQVFHDDSQVAAVHARKTYATIDRPPGIDVTVTALPEGATT